MNRLSDLNASFRESIHNINAIHSTNESYGHPKWFWLSRYPWREPRHNRSQQSGKESSAVHWRGTFTVSFSWPLITITSTTSGHGHEGDV